MKPWSVGGSRLLAFQRGPLFVEEGVIKGTKHAESWNPLWVQSPFKSISVHGQSPSPIWWQLHQVLLITQNCGLTQLGPSVPGEGKGVKPLFSLHPTLVGNHCCGLIVLGPITKSIQLALCPLLLFHSYYMWLQKTQKATEEKFLEHA